MNRPKVYQMRTISLIAATFLIHISAISGEIGIVFNAMMNGNPFVMDQPVPMDNGRYFFSPRMLRFYVAEISFVHDGGLRTKADNVYLLVDVNDVSRYVVGNYDISRIDSLEIHIGVDRIANHNDPSIYPPEHPLALKDPTMHWGWAAGYRFIALEGSAGSTAATAKADVQVHSVGDTLYRRIVIPVTSTVTSSGVDVVLNAEYSALLKDLDVSQGLIFHGYGPETETLTENMATRVFTAATPSSVNEGDQAISTSVHPNPASDVVSVTVSETAANVMLVDAVGRVVTTAELTGGRSSISVATLSVGSYTIVIDAGNGRISHAPLVIIR
ncbi:MAG: T9SS type A sorting domain-containing protein [Ignavibacteria bacterium]|nr:T9SS type A sorting domain-containing protein [Ignavibacteria bacterium]